MPRSSFLSRDTASSFVEDPEVAAQKAKIFPGRMYAYGHAGGDRIAEVIGPASVVGSRGNQRVVIPVGETLVVL